MRWPAFCAFAAILLSSFLPGPSAADPERTSGTCGRADYPSATEYDAASVRNETLWAEFRSAGGFANGTTGEGALEVRVLHAGTDHIVSLTEVRMLLLVGGAVTVVPVLALRVTEEGPPGIIRSVYNFTLVDPSHAGGELALVAWMSDAGLEVFWRWSYLPCDETFPNLYYVFHGRVTVGGIADDNNIVYFEAARPRRGPPADLILLVTAGVAASAIFLLVRRAGRSPRSRTVDSDERTIK